MIELLRIGLVIFLFAASAFFFLVGTLGLIRLPDAFSRMHATTKCDTLGTALALFGLIVLRGFSLVSLKFLIILAFLWLTNPTAAHIIAKATYKKHRPEEPREEK